MAIHCRGVTLIELMVALAVLVIILTLSLPSFTDLITRHRLKGATEKLYQDLQLGRSEAIKRGVEVSISFHPSSSVWCYGKSLHHSCDCTEKVNTRPDYCQIDGVAKITDGAGHNGVSLIDTTFTGDNTGFDPFRGISTDSGSVVFRSGGYSTRIVVSGLGRVRICSDDDALGYPSC